METRCSLCKAPMTCNPEGNCWCGELPHGPMPVDSKEGCLCPECLKKALGIVRLADEKMKQA
jgi:hypothetical protein